MWSFKFRSRPFGYLFKVRWKGAFSKTINYPKFPFSLHLVSIDNRQLNNEWLKFLNSKVADRSRSQYILHDGPPYANGELHMGHALNKILKDITVRYRLLCGQNVSFIPGWDCHGLPIELKAIAQHTERTPREIRRCASGVASHYINIQQSSFMDWGIVADWSGRYTTMDPTFEKAELEAFIQLYSKGLIYRDLLPVHWSYRARTALAESELEYNPTHVSPSAYIRVRLTGTSHLSQTTTGTSNVYGLVWTTTPWTIPANEAIVYDPNASYSLLRSKSLSEAYIVSGQFASQLGTILSVTDFELLKEFQGSELQSCHYIHPVRSILHGDVALYPFLPGSHVVETKGTGLVHCAPCHGKDDFLVGQTFNLPLRQLIDDDGCFLPEAGPQLSGINIEEASDKILELLGSMVVSASTIEHNYPYDWRTKTPVITRLSKQWFLDTSLLADAAIEAYKAVEVIPETQKASMLPFISSRPRWCISRQRSWGVPIPVLLRNCDEQAIVDDEFIQYIADRISKSGSDFWFEEPLDTLVPKRFWEKWRLRPEEATKSTDVFDVWFDSGLSWRAVLQDSTVSPTVADLYLEGQDQFRGWFSASLLLSVALQNCAPYKMLMVHGLTADSEGRKMSKSLGNVMFPSDFLNLTNGCVDILRRWAACSALDSISTVGAKEADLHKASYRTLRNSLRFMLGNLADFSPLAQLSRLSHSAGVRCTHINQVILELIKATQCQANAATQLGALNCTVLYWLGRLVQRARSEHYPNYRFNTLLAELEQFVSHFSSIYLTSVKDSLYCDPPDSSDRRIVQSVLFLTVECLKMLLAPIQPYIVEECEQVLKDNLKESAPMNVNLPDCTLLERYSVNSLRDAEFTEGSDWSTCLAAMEGYTQYSTFADACLTLHSLYLSILSQLWGDLKSPSAPVNPLIDKHVHLYLDPSKEAAFLVKSLQLFHPMIVRSSDSELCKLFRAASVSWIISDSPQAAELIEQHTGIRVFGVPCQDSLVSVQLHSANPETCCPRCRRYTCATSSVLCARCDSVLNSDSSCAKRRTV